MRELTSLVHAGTSGIRTLLNEAYHATLARVVDWALAHPRYFSYGIKTGNHRLPKVMTPPLYLLTTVSGKTRASLLFMANRSVYYRLVNLEFNKGAKGGTRTASP